MTSRPWRARARPRGERTPGRDAAGQAVRV